MPPARTLLDIGVVGVQRGAEIPVSRRGSLFDVRARWRIIIGGFWIEQGRVKRRADEHADPPAAGKVPRRSDMAGGRVDEARPRSDMASRRVRAGKAVTPMAAGDGMAPMAPTPASA